MNNIDTEKLKKRIENYPANLFWFDSRYNKILSTLLEDFEYIIKTTVESINSYEEFAEVRSKIELFYRLKLCSD